MKNDARQAIQEELELIEEIEEEKEKELRALEEFDIYLPEPAFYNSMYGMS